MQYIWLDVVFASLGQAVLSTTLALLMGLPLAYFLHRYDFTGKRLCLALLPLFCIMPTKLVGLGIELLYGLHGMNAIVVGHLILNVPLALYVLCSAYNTYNAMWDLVAQEFGATSWRCYVDMHLPFLLPTIISASCMIFILCFSSASLPLLFGSSTCHLTLDVAMAQAYKVGDNYTVFGYGLLRFLIIACVVSITSKNHGMRGGVLLQQQVSQWYLPSYHGRIWFVVCALIALFVISPLLMVLYASCTTQMLVFFKQIIAGVSDSVLGVPVYRVLVNSFCLACVSACGAVGAGALFIVCRQSKFSAFISLGALLLGSVVCGVLFNVLAATTYVPLFVVAVACHALLNYPFAHRLLMAHMSFWQHEWDLSAQSFGASVKDRYTTLMLPFMRPALLQAWCLAFGLSLTEVGAGSVLGNVTGVTTLPMAIRIYRAQGMVDAALGLSVILLVLVFVNAIIIGALSVARRS